MTITNDPGPGGALRAVPRIALAALTLAAAAPLIQAAPPGSGMSVAPDDHGLIATYNVAGATDLRNPFFLSLGTNGRSCSTCHIASEAMSFTPAHAQQVYEATRGADPLFASVDGANCQNVARGDRAGHSLILGNGLIRIALAVPAGAEYSISVVHDPYGCALQLSPLTGVLTASVYRRPLPATNLSFLSTVMFDGRETVAPLVRRGHIRRQSAHRPRAPGDGCHHGTRAGGGAAERATVQAIVSSS